MDIIYHAISATFCIVVVLSNIISAKLIVFPSIGLSIPAGLVIYPLTFLLSDLVTEFFGVSRAKLMVYLALGMNLLSLAIIELALWLPTDQIEFNNAFKMVLGLSGFRIFASITAYILSQLVDIYLYALIKYWTGPHFLWLRNNFSTCISQLIDTLAVDMIFLYWGLQMNMQQILPIMIFSYLYKVSFSVATTPLFYVCVSIVQNYRKKIAQSFTH